MINYQSVRLIIREQKYYDNIIGKIKELMGNNRYYIIVMLALPPTLHILHIFDSQRQEDIN